MAENNFHAPRLAVVARGVAETVVCNSFKYESSTVIVEVLFGRKWVCLRLRAGIGMTTHVFLIRREDESAEWELSHRATDKGFSPFIKVAKMQLSLLLHVDRV